jgi:hypothetical protein
MACRVQRRIQQDCLHDVPAIKRVMTSLAEETLTCPDCEEKAHIHESDFSPNPGAAIPFGRADSIGCDSTIDRVLEGILQEGARRAARARL